MKILYHKIIWRIKRLFNKEAVEKFTVDGVTVNFF